MIVQMLCYQHYHDDAGTTPTQGQRWTTALPSLWGGVPRTMWCHVNTSVNKLFYLLLALCKTCFTQRFHQNDWFKYATAMQIISRTRSDTHSTETSGHQCPSWIVPDNLYFICRGVTGSISPELSLVKLSHLKGLTRRTNLLMFAKPHTSSSSSVSTLVIFLCHDLYLRIEVVT